MYNMISRIKIIISLLLIIGFLSLINAQNAGIERVEPPFWWIGMKDKNVQLLVYGEHIGSTIPQINYTGVQIKKVHRAHSPNYLFIDLWIAGFTKPGSFSIDFFREGNLVANTIYRLEARDKDMSVVGFNNSDVIYLITPDRFANGDPSNDEINGMREGLNRLDPYGRHGGDFKGIIDHLDYIHNLGFSAIWLNPILENDQERASYHGYATTDYYKVDARFGSNEDYLKLCAEARKRGIKIIMDMIANHCGSRHWWMEDLPFDDWLNYQDNTDVSSQQYSLSNHRKSTLIDPYASKKDRQEMVGGWFVPTMPDLNQNNPFMAKYLIQNSIWWVEYAKIAGIRQDTYSYPYKAFMTDWTCAILQEYPNLNIVGEEWSENQTLISYWQEGKVNTDGYSSCLPSLMDFPMCMSLTRALNEPESFGKGLIELYECLSYDGAYEDPNALVVFPDNHDMSRIYTRLNEDLDLFKMALTYILTTRGIPQIYYGTEILASNPGTDSHGVIRSDYPGGWEGDEVNAFDDIGLNREQIDARNFLRNLLLWRKDKKVIHQGNFLHFIPFDGIYVYFRYNDEQTIMIILNKNEEDQILNLARFDEIIKDQSIGFNPINLRLYNLDESIRVKGKNATILELR